MKKYFFGWENVKWFFKELFKMYSDKPSFFSKKRVDSGIAFAIGQFGMLYWLMNNHTKLTASDIALWAAVEFAICGYMVNLIQKQKTTIEP